MRVIEEKKLEKNEYEEERKAGFKLKEQKEKQFKALEANLI